MANKPESEPAPDLPLEVVGKQLIPATEEEEQQEREQFGEANGPVERNLLTHQHLRKDPWGWAREISLFVSGTGWRGYEGVVGQPSFFPGYNERVKTAVLSSSILEKKLHELADKRVATEREQGLVTNNAPERREEILKSLRDVVDLMTEQMMCKMDSRPFIRSAYYFVSQLLTRAYHQGIHVDREEVIRLRATAERAAKENKSIVFLPSHKTHIDYISLQVICYRLGITLPIVVAGDNLNFPVVGGFLQHVGAMWIRRSFGEDALYSTLVQSYIDTVLRLGYNFECFIEGGRSRTGKLLSPKYGILSFILESVRSGRIADCLICPVSIQYDKVIEVDSYVSELLGKPKVKENLQDFISASSVLSLKLGRVDVRFKDPWSLKDFIAEQEQRLVKTPNGADSGDGRAATRKARMLRTLGYKVLSDINGVSVVMPTALVGTVLLTLRGRGVGKSQLASKVEWLRDRIQYRGGRVAHFHGLETRDVVERALEVLGPALVGEVHDIAEPTYFAVDRFQLSFYRNMTIHLFISEALISAALYTKVKQGGSSTNQQISWDELRKQVIFLSQLFRGEFIFQAGEGFEANLNRTMSMLQVEQMIEVIEDDNGTRMVGLTDIERQSGRETFDFYCFLIWPFIEAAWLGAVSLISLTPPLDVDPEISVNYAKAQDAAQLLGKTLYHQGDLSYFEAVNKEALRNTYTRFEEEAMVIRSKALPPNTKPSKSSAVASPLVPVVRVSPDWSYKRDPNTGHVIAAGRLWDFTEMIAKSRREGKARRDGATVSTRVVGLAERVGQGLLFGDVVEQGGVREKSVMNESEQEKEESELAQQKKFRRRSRL